MFPTIVFNAVGHNVYVPLQQGRAARFMAQYGQSMPVRVIYLANRARSR